MPEVELRLTDVDPPDPDPKRSIYTDLVNLPDPVYLGLTVRIYNYDDVTLYMKVDGYNSAWTFTTNNLGALASGANMYRNLDNLANRAKPSAAVTESLTVRLRAYTDSGYTTLKWTFERVIDVVFIKSDDGSWTQDALNNFDDGTVQGWAAVNETGNDASFPTAAVATDYVLSTPYSLKMAMKRTVGTAGYARGRLWKSFTTPNRNNVYAIVDLRVGQGDYGGDYVNQEYLTVNKDADVLVFLGRPSGAGLYIPENKWMRLVVPLTKNVTLEVRYILNAWFSATDEAWVWIDDFKIISKD